MIAHSDIGILKLRAHHICCLPFLTTDFSSERGAGYLRVRNKIKKTFRSEPDFTIMVIEGVDELCRECPLCKGNRCESQHGNENEVRKWDAILVKELGISFGDALIVREWQSLISEKTPFKLCQRCGWRESCSVGSQVT